MLAFPAALLLALASTASHAQDDPAAQRQPKALACATPVMPKEALRYELSGETRLLLDLDDAGKPTNLRVTRSSGWRMLDAASVKAAATCRYAPPTDPAFKRADIKAVYNWSISPPRANQVPAALVAGSCPVSDRFADFRPLAGDVTASEGLLVRFVLDSAGKPFGIFTEGDSSPELYQAAVAYLGACRFTPATEDGRPGHGNLFGRLLPKQA